MAVNEKINNQLMPYPSSKNIYNPLSPPLHSYIKLNIYITALRAAPAPNRPSGPADQAYEAKPRWRREAPKPDQDYEAKPRWRHEVPKPPARERRAWRGATSTLRVSIIGSRFARLVLRVVPLVLRFSTRRLRLRSF